MQCPILNQRGFTLLEAMISLLILSVGILGAAAMQGHAIRASTTAYNRTGADSVAMAFVEAMLSMPYKDIDADRPTLIDKGVETARRSLAAAPNTAPPGEYYTWGRDYKNNSLLTKLMAGVAQPDPKILHRVCDQANKCYSMVWSIKKVDDQDQAKIMRLLMVWETPYGSNHLVYTTTLQNTSTQNTAAN